MSLSSNTDALATRLASEFNALRNELWTRGRHRADWSIPLPVVGSLGWRWPVPHEIDIEDFALSAGVAPNATLTLDVHYSVSGVTIFTTQGNRPSLASGNQLATAFVPDVTSLAGGGYLDVQVDAAGGTAAKVLLSMFYRHV